MYHYHDDGIHIVENKLHRFIFIKTLSSSFILPVKPLEFDLANEMEQQIDLFDRQIDSGIVDNAEKMMYMSLIRSSNLLLRLPKDAEMNYARDYLSELHLEQSKQLIKSLLEQDIEVIFNRIGNKFMVVLVDYGEYYSTLQKAYSRTSPIRFLRNIDKIRSVVSLYNTDQVVIEGAYHDPIDIDDDFIYRLHNQYKKGQAVRSRNVPNRIIFCPSTIVGRITQSLGRFIIKNKVNYSLVQSDYDPDYMSISSRGSFTKEEL